MKRKVISFMRLQRFIIKCVKKISQLEKTQTDSAFYSHKLFKNSFCEWNGDRHFGSANGDKKINRHLATHVHIQDKADSGSLISF